MNTVAMCALERTTEWEVVRCVYTVTFSEMGDDAEAGSVGGP